MMMSLVLREEGDSINLNASTQQFSPIQGRFGLDKRPVDNLKVQVDGCLLPSLVSRLTIMSKDDSATSA